MTTNSFQKLVIKHDSTFDSSMTFESFFYFCAHSLATSSQMIALFQNTAENEEEVASKTAKEQKNPSN